MTKKKLRIVYMGTPDFAVLPLKKIIEDGFNVVGVITNPDKPAGRGQKLRESAVKIFAREAGLKILQPEKFRDVKFLEELRSLKADLQLVVAFKMLPEVVWDMPRLGTVNLHASLLPDYRGAAPINWAVMNGEKYSGVSTFLLKHEIDTGSLIFQEKVVIGDNMSAGELHDELMNKGSDLLIKTVKAIECDDYPLISQDELLGGREAIHAPKIFKPDMKIDWNLGLDKVFNHIRGLSPFPGAWAELERISDNKLISIKIFKTQKISQFHDFSVGSLVSDGKRYLDVYMDGGKIRVEQLQLSGKRRMSIEEFLMGFNISDYKFKL
ncbi:MAG: methionyl-tRNA formyltransferase [Bacteroides sp.]|nr:methionyl-tRNA formyltransferase [Bacteroides sp.]